MLSWGLELRCTLGVEASLQRHDVLWVYCHNNGQFATFKEFRRALKRKGGARVHHIRGLPAQTDVRRLMLHPAKDASEQGGFQKRALKQTGKGVLLQRTLCNRSCSQPRKRPDQNKNGFANSRRSRDRRADSDNLKNFA